MGLKFSRQESLPIDIDLQYEMYKESWYNKRYLERNVNQIFKDETTLCEETLIKAGSIISDFIKSNSIDMKILEIMAGNCLASKIIYDSIKKDNQTINLWKSTELQDFSQIIAPLESTIISPEFNIDYVDAVKNYGTNYNTLLMVSPPPSSNKEEYIDGYGDYFAVREWTELPNVSYIVIIGELGASDGSAGMYKYMMEHNIWKLKQRVLLSKTTDIFGGPCEKEIFIFGK
jgi:hypothetical protein